MIKLWFTIVLALMAYSRHAQNIAGTSYCQRQAQYEYQLRISAPPMSPEVFPGQNGGQAAAYVAAWSQRVFLECLRRLKNARRDGAEATE